MSSFVQKLPGLRRAGGSSTRKRLPKISVVFAVAAAAMLTLLVGAVVALGAVQLTVILSALLAFVPILLFVNTRMLLPMLFVVVFLVQGMAQYFLDFRMAPWMASALAGLFLLRSILELTGYKREAAPRQAQTFGSGTVMLCMGLYMLFYFFSLAMGRGSLVQIIATLRFAVPMLGVLMALYWFKWSDTSIRNIWRLMFVIAVCQIPIVIYQHLFKVATLGWDGVVGSFGLNMSAPLAVFMVGCVLYALSRWNRGLMPLRTLILCLIATLSVILAVEVKAVLIWLPLGIMWILRKRMFRNIGTFIIFSSFALLLSVGTYSVYKVMFWGAHTRDDTISEKFDTIAAYALDPGNINYRTGEISRAASLALWYSDPAPTAIQRLVGYGPGASAKSPSTGYGVVAERYRMLSIAATAVASLLWDVGILGMLCYAAIFVSAIVAGVRYTRRAVNPEHAAIVDVCVAMVAIFLNTLIYNRTMIDEPTAQLLCYFCIGCIVHYCRNDAAEIAAASVKPRMSKSA